MVDNGSIVDILYYSAIANMGLRDFDLKLVTTSLYSFIGDFIRPRGRIDLPLTIGEFSRTSTVMIEFLVVDYPSTFNALLGRPKKALG